MNGCGAWQSPMRLPNHRPRRSAGRSQERRQPARVSERTLDSGPARRLSDALRISDNGRPILTVRSSTKFYTLALSLSRFALSHSGAERHSAQRPIGGVRYYAEPKNSAHCH